MRFTLANDNDVYQDPNNGESEAGFTSDASRLCGSLACTTVWSTAGTITETDVWFDVDYDWTLNDYKYDSVAYDPAMYRPLVNTAIHEFTHTLGMAHESGYFQVMGNAWNVVSTNGDYTESVISEDTTKGLRDLYGPRGWQNEDLSLYHWELAGASGAYSTHGRTDLSYPGGVPIPQLIGTLEPVYRVAAGDTIKVEQTAENRGSNTQTVKIRWYVSTDSLITTSDDLIASSNITVAVNTPFTWKRRVTLPGTLVSGQRYWIGAIIDADGVLSEQNEINNAIYIAELSIL